MSILQSDVESLPSPAPSVDVYSALARKFVHCYSIFFFFFFACLFLFAIQLFKFSSIFSVSTFPKDVLPNMYSILFFHVPLY